MVKNIFMEEKEEDESVNMNPSCVRGLIDYHQWRHIIQKILKGYHAKISQDCDFTANHVEENVYSSPKKKGLTKRRSLRPCSKRLINQPITKERADEEVGSKSLSRSRLDRSFSMHRISLDIPSNWDHSIIFIPGNKDGISPEDKKPDVHQDYGSQFEMLKAEYCGKKKEDHFLNKMDPLNRTFQYRDKPKITSLFEDMKDFLNHELKYIKEDLSYSWHYQLLLDLVMEEMVHLHDTSSSYYPKALSRSCHIRRFPVGTKILEEVCSSISALMNLMEDESKCIDGAVDLDMKRDNSWMNLQLKSECVVLDVENIIFQELIEELKC